MKRSECKAWLAALALTGISIVIVTPAAAGTTYGGRAMGCMLDTPQLPPVTACDTGELPSGGGSLTDFVPNAQLSGNDEVVLAASLTASASASGMVSQCESQAEGLSIELHELLLSATITATSVACVAAAVCGELTGQTSISGLVVAGVSVTVTGEANQTVQIPGIATVVINEQVEAAGQITVNALHVTCLDATEIVVCSARALTDCTLPTEESTWGEVKSLYR